MLLSCPLIILCKFQFFYPILSKPLFAPVHICGLQPNFEHKLVFSYMCSSMCFCFLQLCLPFLASLPLALQHHIVYPRCCSTPSTPINMPVWQQRRAFPFFSTNYRQCDNQLHKVLWCSLEPLGGSTRFIFANGFEATSSFFTHDTKFGWGRVDFWRGGEHCFPFLDADPHLQKFPHRKLITTLAFLGKVHFFFYTFRVLKDRTQMKKLLLKGKNTFSMTNYISAVF